MRAQRSDPAAALARCALLRYCMTCSPGSPVRCAALCLHASVYNTGARRHRLVHMQAQACRRSSKQIRAYLSLITREKVVGRMRLEEKSEGRGVASLPAAEAAPMRVCLADPARRTTGRRLFCPGCHRPVAQPSAASACVRHVSRGLSVLTDTVDHPIRVRVSVTCRSERAAASAAKTCRAARPSCPCPFSCPPSSSCPYRLPSSPGLQLQDLPVSCLRSGS